MITKKKKFHVSLLIALTVLCVTSLGSCNRTDEGSDLQKGAALLRDYAVKSNPALKGSRFNISLSIDGGLGDCMCIKVCDSNGQNCSECTCTPANCGGCD